MGDYLKTLDAVAEFVNRGKESSKFHDSKFPRKDGTARVPYLTIYTIKNGYPEVWVQKTELDAPSGQEIDATLTGLLDITDENKKRKMLEELEKQSDFDTTVVGAFCASGRDDDLDAAIGEMASANISNSEAIGNKLPDIRRLGDVDYTYFRATGKWGPIETYDSAVCANYVLKMPAGFTLEPLKNKPPFKALTFAEIKDALNHGRFKPGSAHILSYFITITTQKPHAYLKGRFYRINRDTEAFPLEGSRITDIMYRFQNIDAKISFQVNIPSVAPFQNSIDPVPVHDTDNQKSLKVPPSLHAHLGIIRKSSHLTLLVRKSGTWHIWVRMPPIKNPSANQPAVNTIVSNVAYANKEDSRTKLWHEFQLQFTNSKASGITHTDQFQGMDSISHTTYCYHDTIFRSVKCSSYIAYVTHEPFRPDANNNQE